MRMMALLAGIGLFVAAGQAKAAPLTLVEAGGFTMTLSANQFDVADATLTGVSVRFEGGVGGTLRR